MSKDKKTCGRSFESSLIHKKIHIMNTTGNLQKSANINLMQAKRAFRTCLLTQCLLPIRFWELPKKYRTSGTANLERQQSLYCR